MYEQLPTAASYNSAYLGRGPVPYLEQQTWQPWGAEARRNHLEQLPAEGFTQPQHETLVDNLVAIGLPVDNVVSLHRRENKRGTEQVLGSWGIGSDNYGQFSEYDLIDRVIPEKKLGTLFHESIHANSAFDERNAHKYGGEEGRQAAATYFETVANQSLLTDKYLNGYHSYLADRYFSGKPDENGNVIDLPTFHSETEAILSEMAFVNPKKVEQVEAAQFKAIHAMAKNGAVYTGPVERLITRPGESAPKGADRTLIQLLEGVGVHDVDSLRDHATSLKQSMYTHALPELGSTDVFDDEHIRRFWQDYMKRFSQQAIARTVHIDSAIWSNAPIVA